MDKRLQYDILDAIKKYYNTLNKVGYIKDKEGENLILISYILDILTSDYVTFLTEEDLKLFQRILNKLKKCSCVFNPEFIYKETFIGSEFMNGVLRSFIVDNNSDTGIEFFQLYGDLTNKRIA